MSGVPSNCSKQNRFPFSRDGRQFVLLSARSCESLAKMHFSQRCSVTLACSKACYHSEFKLQLSTCMVYGPGCLRRAQKQDQVQEANTTSVQNMETLIQLVSLARNLFVPLTRMPQWKCAVHKRISVSCKNVLGRKGRSLRPFGHAYL